MWMLFLVGLLGAGDTASSAAPSGTPWTMHTIDNGSEGADGVRLADMNGDGLPDIATGWEEGGSIRVYLNPGTEKAKAPWPKVVVGSVGSPEDAVMGDMDGDGAVDVVSCSEGKTQQIWIHWAPVEKARMRDGAAWTTEALPAAANRAKWMFSVPFDVNGDGRLDLVAGAKGDGAAIGWFEAPATPRDLAAWQWHPIRDAAWIMSLELHDMNGDGLQDIVYTDRRGAQRKMGWLEHPGHDAESFGARWRDHEIGGAGREVMFLHMEVEDSRAPRRGWCTTRDGGILRFARQNPATWEVSEIAMPAEVGTGKGIATGDLDLDGVEDLVISCENAEGKQGIFWLQTDAQGHWNARTIGGLTGTKYDLVVLHDFDGDGDLDVLTCEERELLGVVWYENPAR